MTPPVWFAAYLSVGLVVAGMVRLSWRRRGKPDSVGAALVLGMWWPVLVAGLVGDWLGLL